MTRRLCAVASLFSAGVLVTGLAACSLDLSPFAASGSVGAASEAGQLVGATDATLLSTFGPPSQLRREPPAEVWQYSSPACVVDFYLYQLSSAQLSVVHLEARSPVTGRLPVETCLREL